MNKRKLVKLYYFSFEGETEKWYLEWLENKINNSEDAIAKVSFKLTGKDPIKAIKNLSPMDVPNIYHICDYEDNNDDRIIKTVIDSIRNAEKLKKVKYHLAYSNLAFELWIILHRKDCNKSLVNNSAYLQYINKCYNENFQSLNGYKEEHNFKRILSKITLDEVKNAIFRAKQIMLNNKNNGFRICDYRKEKYYKENPSLSIHEIIEKIFKDCGL